MANSVSTEDAKLLHESRRLMYERAEQYRKSFIDKSTGLINDKYLEKRSCPVCEADQSHEVFKKTGGTYVVCGRCSMVFINPVFKDQELVKYYQMNNSNQAQAHNSEIEFYRRIYASGLNLLARYKSGGSLLDIGCSSGLFLDIAASRYSSYGIELNKAEVRIARSKGHAVWDQPIEMVSFGNDDKFDVITLWDVFEHIKDGKTYLQKLKPRLREDGVIFLQIPNVGSLAARVMRDKCNMFDGLEHVNLYSLDTIKMMALRAGYKVHDIVSVIDELKPVINYLGYEDPYNGSFIHRDDLDFLTTDLVISKMLGYKLQVVLKVN
jgi:2-polyprenyl-3-methyl-5-hydroxy-6-metoxy-1,4-benzoquinol methylase